MEDVEMKGTSCLDSTVSNDQLLRAVQSNDLGYFKKLLEMGLESSSVDLNHIFDEPYYGTILDICCSSTGRSEFAKVLLSTDNVNVNAINENRRNAPIHNAAANGLKNTLEVVLEHSKIDVNLQDSNGNTALHLAAKAGHVECAEMLLEAKNISANRKNRKGVTPAYLAATSKNKNDELMLAFIRSPKVDLDVQPNWGESLRSLIDKNYPHLTNEVPPEGTRDVTQYCDNPFEMLYANDVEDFISHVTTAKSIDLNGDDGKHTYLQYACDTGLLQVVNVLLDLGADPNGTCPFNTKHPIFIASYRGFADIIQTFLNSNKSVCYQTGDNTALIEVIKGSDENHDSLTVDSELCRHDEAFETLLEKSVAAPSELDINRADDKGNTCLHYAAKVGKHHYISRLLDRGAYIGKRNVFGDPPLADISPKDLETHLDKCVRSNGRSPKDVNYEIIFSYQFLCPPKVYQKKDADNQRAQLEGQVYTPENIPETDPLLYISEVPELRHLLKHPVLTSFVHLKWFTIKRYYKVNLAVYMAFWSLLTLYTLMTSNDGISDGPPSNATNVTEIPAPSPNTSNGPSGNALTVYLWAMVLVFLGALILRELIQFVLSPFSYLTSLENWLEICLFALTSVLLLGDTSHRASNRNQISAVVILLSWGELILLVGKHPALATNLEMFKRVTKNFLKFLVWYSILIVAFALSFYMVFKDNVGVGDGDDDNKFAYPSSSIFKTVVMLTGEFDSSGLPFSLHPVVSHALFLLFIFLVAIVLVNLLNGLAVSDTQAIRLDAEIVTHVSRVKLINYFETMAIGDPLSWVHKAQNHVDDLGCDVPALCTTRQFFQRIRLFAGALRVPELRVLPNQRNAVDFGLPAKKSQFGCVAMCQGYYLDKEIVNEAKSIIKSQSEGSEEASCMEVLNAFAEKFNGVEKAVEEIKRMLNAMNTKSEVDSIALSCSSPASSMSYVNVQ